MEINYKYCKIDRWVDATTVDLIIDLGFYITIKQRFKLAFIKSPDPHSPGSIDANTKVNQLAPIDSLVEITSHGKDLNGYWLITLKNRKLQNSINDELVYCKLAKYI